MSGTKNAKVTGHWNRGMASVCPHPRGHERGAEKAAGPAGAAAFLRQQQSFFERLHFMVQLVPSTAPIANKSGAPDARQKTSSSMALKAFWTTVL